MTRGEAERIIGGLGATSKMPGPSYGLPIAACAIGAVLRARDPESVCRRCYAARYRPSVKDAQRRRLDAVRRALADPAAAELYVEAFGVLLNGSRRLGPVGWFRWFDSGDLQGAAHLALIARVARATPRTRHWLPTREYAAVRQWLASGEPIPQNLRIRLSAHTVGEAPKLPAPLAAELGPRIGHHGLAQSAVAHHGQELTGPLGGFKLCPAPAQGGSCDRCRECWGPRPVAYRVH